MWQGTTRLLVTHQRHHLPGCDRVIVLRDGAVAADGTFAALAASGAYAAELGAGLAGEASSATAELDDTAYDAGLAAAEGTSSDKDAAAAQASGIVDAVGDDCTQQDASAASGASKGTPPGVGAAAELASSGGGSSTAQSGLPADQSNQNTLASPPGAGTQEPAKVPGNAAGRAVVPASVFGGGQEDDSRKGSGWSTIAGKRVDGVGGMKGELSSKASSRYSGLQSAASRMRRELSRCASARECNAAQILCLSTLGTLIRTMHAQA